MMAPELPFASAIVMRVLRVAVVHWRAVGLRFGPEGEDEVADRDAVVAVLLGGDVVVHEGDDANFG